MGARSRPALQASAQRLLAALAAGKCKPRASQAEDIDSLIRADLACACPDGMLALTDAGRAYLLRQAAAKNGDEIDPFVAQHLDEAVPAAPGGPRSNAAESPLVWLARRKGRDGEPLIAPEQLQAGEKLRVDFTFAQLMPRVTSNWSAAGGQSPRSGASPINFADNVIAARQRVRHALDAVGPEFAGLLVDVCCFLKGLDDVERERRWPVRSAKVVLQLGLTRLARHYGLGHAARGPTSAPIRSWAAPWGDEGAADAP
jgi:hypothetical protein